MKPWMWKANGKRSKQQWSTYKRFVDATNYAKPNHWKNSEIPQGFENHPVVYVGWKDAQAFCQWAKVRLPTEAEWEKAARGVDGAIYPWGNTPPNDDLLNYNKRIGTTTAVGNYPNGKSGYGVLDMAGNVWEWVSDWYDGKYYKNSPTKDPAGPASGNYHVIRGGSWYNEARGVRSSDRYLRFVNDSGYYGVGFRVVQSVFPGS